jgi:hypothetical protein
MASRLSPASVDLVGAMLLLGKASVGGVSSSSPARASDDEVASRLLAQPTLQLKPASLA